MLRTEAVIEIHYFDHYLRTLHIVNGFFVLFYEFKLELFWEILEKSFSALNKSDF